MVKAMKKVLVCAMAAALTLGSAASEIGRAHV